MDTRSDQPSFATVRVGAPTRRRLVFVPLDRTTVGPGYLNVGYDRTQVRHAPSIGTTTACPTSPAVPASAAWPAADPSRAGATTSWHPPW